MKKYLDLFLTFFKIGAFTLGGGFAMLPLIEREVVDKKGWIEEEEMIDVIAISQSIPGGIAINASTIVGYKVCGGLGSIVSIVGVSLPSFISILLIAIVLTNIPNLEIMEAAFKGVRATVVALIGIAAYSFGKIILTSYGTIIIFSIALVLLLWGQISAILVIIIGGLLGYGMNRAVDRWGGRN